MSMEWPPFTKNSKNSKNSAYAADASEKGLIKSIIDAINDLIQISTDNFDDEVHTQNGTKETHSLMTIVT